MSAAIKPTRIENTLPNSRRIYIDGEQPGVRVPFREVDQSPTRNFDNTLEENPPVRVYDSSGPWGDPASDCEVRDGLPPLRRDWIISRDDVEDYEGRELQPIDDGYLTFDSANQARQKEKALGLNRLEDFPALRRTPLRAKQGRCVTQMHYARQGIITPEMEFIAIRENLGRESRERRHPVCISYEEKSRQDACAPSVAPRDSLDHQHGGESFGASI